MTQGQDIPWPYRKALSLYRSMRGGNFLGRALLGRWEAAGFVSQSDPDGGVFNKAGIEHPGLRMPARLSFSAGKPDSLGRGQLAATLDKESVETFGLEKVGTLDQPQDFVSLNREIPRGGSFFLAFGQSYQCAYSAAEDLLVCELFETHIWWNGKDVQKGGHYLLAFARRDPAP